MRRIITIMVERLATIQGIPIKVSMAHALFVTIHSIRKSNLLALIAERGPRGQTILAEQINKSASQVNQYAHSKPMGHGFARAVEKALRKPLGWMDRDNSAEKQAAPPVGPVSLHGFQVSYAAAEAAADWQKLHDADPKAAESIRQMLYLLVAAIKRNEVAAAQKQECRNKRTCRPQPVTT